MAGGVAPAPLYKVPSQPLLVLIGARQTSTNFEVLEGGPLALFYTTLRWVLLKYIIGTLQVPRLGKYLSKKCVLIASYCDFVLTALPGIPYPLIVNYNTI